MVAPWRPANLSRVGEPGVQVGGLGSRAAFVQDSGDQMAEDIVHPCQPLPFTLSKKGAIGGSEQRSPMSVKRTMTQAPKRSFVWAGQFHGQFFTS